MSHLADLHDDQRLSYVDNWVADSLLAEYQSADEVDSKNAAQLHLLLYHLSSRSTDFSCDTNIPPLTVLRVLLTLVARAPMVNRSHGNQSLLSGSFNMHSSEDLASAQRLHDLASAQRLHDLARMVMSSYLEALEVYERDEDFTKLLALFASFIVEPKMFGMISALAPKTPQSKPSTSRRRPLAKADLESPDLSEVSDSEAEFSKLEAVVKDQLCTSPEKVHNPLMQTLLSDSRPPSRRERTPPVTKKEISLFGDKLITEKLKPTKSSTYCMWSLLRWAFYCASCATERGSLKTSVYCSIYESYRDFTWLVLRFTSIDFKRFSNRFQSLEHDETQAMKLKHLKKDTLLATLIAQSAARANSWYDRILEQTFAGLDVSVISRPPACFATEASLTLREPVGGETSGYNCDVDSLELRLEIVRQVYGYSLFHSKAGFADACIGAESKLSIEIIDLENPLSALNFIQQLTKRLLEIRTVYFEEFFLAALDRIGADWSRDLVALCLETSCAALFELTNDLEVHSMKSDLIPLLLSDASDKANIAPVVLQYSTEIIEGVVAEASDSRDQLRKVNFLVYWLLNIASIVQAKEPGAVCGSAWEPKAIETVQRKLERLWSQHNVLPLPWSLVQ